MLWIHEMGIPALAFSAAPAFTSQLYQHNCLCVYMKTRSWNEFVFKITPKKPQTKQGQIDI